MMVTRANRARLTRAGSRRSQAAGRAVRARQAHSLGRSVPVQRDPLLVETHITSRLVRHGAKIIDRDLELIDWLADKLAEAQEHVGRPSEVSLRTSLICFWLLSVTQKNFHVVNLPALLDSMTWRIRRQLGVDYVTAGGIEKQVSYNQLLRVFHTMADAFDPYEDGLDILAARRRAADLQEFVNRLVRASTADVQHGGNYAVDATMKWAHERPRSGQGKKDLNHKIKRRGKDGDAGKPATLSQIIGADVDELDDIESVLERDPLAADLATDPAKKSRYNQTTWGRGADWVGRKNVKKAVFGYALHTATVSDSNAPNIIEGLVVTTAKALPAPAIMPVLRSIFDARTALLADPTTDTTGLALGVVVADPAYSANVNDWQLPLRALGASSPFRLHKTNQQGRREVAQLNVDGTEYPEGDPRRRNTLFIDGRPVCACAAHAVPDRRFPTFPYTSGEVAKYQSWADIRDSFEYKPNGPWHPDGGRQFFTKHYNSTTATGGCEYCVDAFGQPVIDPDTLRIRPPCCTKLSIKFNAVALGLYQSASFGSKDWFKEWNPRNRVEGSYGVLKNLAIINWGRDYHHFVGLARETLVAAFAIMAYNFHMKRTFAAAERLRTEKAEAKKREERNERARRRRRRQVLAKPSAQPTLTVPGSSGPGREPPPDPFGPMDGPVGLEFLGSPHGP